MTFPWRFPEAARALPAPLYPRVPPLRPSRRVPEAFEVVSSLRRCAGSRCWLEYLCAARWSLRLVSAGRVGVSCRPLFLGRMNCLVISRPIYSVPMLCKFDTTCGKRVTKCLSHGRTFNSHLEGSTSGGRTKLSRLFHANRTAVSLC